MDENKNREVFQLIGLLKAKTWKRTVMPDIGFFFILSTVHDCSGTGADIFSVEGNELK